MIRTQLVRLYPNKVMRKHLDDLCDYRRYCWNLGLETWNNMYQESLIVDNKKLKPNWQKVRNELVHVITPKLEYRNTNVDDSK